MGDTPLDVTGVKTFFVVPDLSLFPEENLRHFCLQGFESYFLEADQYCPLESKIDILFSIFQQVILFFNIDREVHGIDWPSYIRSLQKKYGERAMIGVMYCKRNNFEEVRWLERLYLYDIGIVCGCISLEYQKAKNLSLFMNVLIANQANGQRKHIRAICDSGFKMNMMYRGKQFLGCLRDISISHFSCVFQGECPELPLHEKVYDMQMSLHGVLMKVNAVFCLKRVIVNDEISVFVFRSSDDREGLDPDLMVKVNGVIFNSLQACMMYRLKAEFDNERQRRLRERQEKIAAHLAPEDLVPNTKAAEKLVKELDVAKLLETIG